MKSYIAVFLAIASVAAKGSGPYLPSGWRPDGPAFHLPSETQKPSDNPLKETLLQESEASSSDALREYGPPKLDESPLQITNQGLPDVITEQTFFEAKSGQQLVESVADVEVNTEQVINIIETIVTTTESQEAALEETTSVSEETTFEAKKLNIDATEENLEVITEETSNERQNYKVLFEENSVTERLEDSVKQSSKLSAKVDIVEENLEIVTEIVEPTTVAVAEKVVENAIEAAVEHSAQYAKQIVGESVESVQAVVVPILVLAAEETAVGENVRDQEVLVPTAVVVKEKFVDENAKTAQDVVEPTAVVIEDVQDLPTTFVVDKTIESVGEARNIAGALNNLAKEVIATEVQAVEGVTDFKVTQETSGSIEQLPEGFLEYGLPGFKEYGPPKEDNLSPAAIQVLSDNDLENSEIRRRRFSPKFRSSKKTH